MSRNPDRQFSADYLDEQEREDLRALLRRSEIADLFDPAVCGRIGTFISRAVFDPAKPNW